MSEKKPLLPQGLQVLIIPTRLAAELVLTTIRGLGVVAQTFGNITMLLIDPRHRKKK